MLSFHRVSPALRPVVLGLFALLPSAASADTPGSRSVGEELCAGRPGCTVHRVMGAGRNARRELIQVIGVKLPFRDGDACEQLTDCNCTPHEYWRTVGATAQRAQKILEVCTSDEEAARAVEQNLEVGANRLTFHRLGGATWAWDRSALVQLDPPRVLQEGWASWSTYARHNEERTSWSWRTFSGVTKWTIPECTESGEAPEGDAVRTRSFAYVPIPRVSVPVAFSWEGWRVFSMETCSARASADAKSGYLLKGAPGTRGDASVFALATPRALFIEVLDDHRTRDDVLTVWLTEPPAAYSDHCYAQPPEARRWSIRLSDGEVLSRSPGLLQVEMVQLEGRTRLKLGTRISENAGIAVSLTDVDGDDGDAPVREIATADLTRGDVGAVGRQFQLDSERARCVLRQGMLVPRIMPPRDRADPLLRQD